LRCLLAAVHHTIRYWNQVNLSGGEKLPFGDGAGADNTAITPLLRRRVPKIIAIVAAIKSVTDMTAEQWAGNQWETSGEVRADQQPGCHTLLVKCGVVDTL
jgi:hypothetical protein